MDEKSFTATIAASSARAVVVSPDASLSKQKTWVTFLTISSFCSKETNCPSTASFSSSAEHTRN